MHCHVKACGTFAKSLEYLILKFRLKVYSSLLITVLEYGTLALSSVLSQKCQFEDSGLDVQSFEYNNSTELPHIEVFRKLASILMAVSANFHYFDGWLCVFQMGFLCDFVPLFSLLV